ncbi:MAG: ATP-binding protein [Elusimicrobiales bacterium]|nr:ATP-binding protein [Elusimicrobiales bacterium]
MGHIININIESIFKLAADNSIVPYFITDIEGKIIYANDALSKNTGYNLNEILGQKASIFKSGKHNEIFYKKMWDSILKGTFYRTRIINKRKDGNFYQVMLTIQPIKINGEIKYFLAREEDLTFLIELENKLIESQKLESIALMIGELSHDFNNFLTVVIGALDLIKDELKDGTSVKQLAEELTRSAKNQAHTIRQLLTFARKSQPNLTETDINNMLIEIKSLIESQLTVQIKLEYHLSPELKKTKVDEQQIKQAIFNITQNAKDAIGNTTGIVTIKTYNYQNLSEYNEPYHEGEYIVIEITDSGTGISEEALKHLFEPFFTTKPKGKGTGLGLSSVYGIVKNHGGYIYASNRTDGKQGAVFRIYLPALN